MFCQGDTKQQASNGRPRREGKPLRGHLPSSRISRHPTSSRLPQGLGPRVQTLRAMNLRLEGSFLGILLKCSRWGLTMMGMKGDIGRGLRVRRQIPMGIQGLALQASVS